MFIIRTAAAVLAAALAFTQITACTATARDRSTGQVIDDSALTARVKASIAQEQGVNAAVVNVTTYRGVVQLSGFVESDEAKRRAGQAARDVEEVKEVRNDLVVAPRGGTGASGG
ncbi:MAG TPA: BON domain-containing protein [Burkholderiales bacterium]